MTRYAEVVGNTQFTLNAIIHKLYEIVRNCQAWELGEPGFNDSGLPAIHDIAQSLGCIQFNSDAGLSASSFPPRDGLVRLNPSSTLKNRKLRTVTG